ncbi:MAG: hypothetical protein HEQ35_07445 [Gloeotrichia echinulata IR180]
MEADQLIQAFTEVVRNQYYVFAQADIPKVQAKIAELETELPNIVAETIRQWYLDYEDVRDAVLIAAREIDRVSKTQPQAQENTQENRYRVLQEELQKLQDKKTKSN